MLGNQVTQTENVASKVLTFTATQSQTAFTITGGYRINQIAIYRNGVRLVDGRDVLARDGTTINLQSAAVPGDVIEAQVFDDFKVAAALDVNSGGTVSGDTTITGNFDIANKGAGAPGVTTSVLQANGDDQWLDTYGVIKSNRTTISETLTIDSGTNGMSAGPITIGVGYTVTVNGDWVVL